MVQINKSTLAYISDLANNNEKSWIEANKDAYLSAKDDFQEFANHVGSLMSQHDKISRVKIFRIYRDVRFSKDKTPYKSHFSVEFQRATALRRGSYYLQVDTNGAFLAGGFWGPEKDDLKRIREEFAADPQSILKIINDRKFVSTFGTLKGDSLKTMPRGFDADTEAVDLIKKKQFYVEKSFSREEVLSKDFASKVDATYQVMRPYLDYMSTVLTTNLNGELIV